MCKKVNKSILGGNKSAKEIQGEYFQTGVVVGNGTRVQLDDAVVSIDGTEGAGRFSEVAGRYFYSVAIPWHHWNQVL